MIKTFKVEFTLKSNNDIDPETIKQRLYRKVNDFDVENSEGVDVNMEVYKYWEEAKVTEI